MPIEATNAEDTQGQDTEDQSQGVEYSQDDSTESGDDFVENPDPSDAGALDVKLALDEDKKAEMISYLQDNLPNMRMSEKDADRLKSYLAMYDMAAERRNFPYENAPSLPSSDAYDKLNEWLDKAEVAFLITNGTFAIDREETALDEQKISRMQRTFHKKFFWASGFADELRLILFEAGYLGGSILSVDEVFDVEPQREKLIIKTDKDLADYQLSITREEYKEAQVAVAKGDTYLTERDILKVNNAGARVSRKNQTKFLCPQNVTDYKKWQIVSEMEFYTKSDLLAMAEMGELDKDEVNKAISKNRERVQYNSLQKKGEELPEGVKANDLDLSHNTNIAGISEYGDSYEDEFCIYRTTMKYKVPTKEDPNGALRSWIQVIYCPAGGNILSSNFCKYGFPFFIVQYRPVPHRAIGTGIAQARYPFNVLDSDMKSLYMASLEQEIGSPLLIKKDSDLWGTGFRSYPGAVAYTRDPEKDIRAFQMPEKSRLAVEGMKIVLGSSPDANKGAGYASGKREQILQEQKNVTDQSRMHAIAVGLDAPINLAWRITCQIAKLNNDKQKWIKWVYKNPPTDTKLYMLDEEMNPNIVWTSVLSAISMSPDALFSKAMQLKQIFHDSVPVSVNSPRLTTGWLNFVANFVPEMDDKNRQILLPSEQDFQQYQQQLGQMGGQREGQPSTPAVSQSQKTPFSRPPQGGHGAPQGNGAFNPKSPTPSDNGAFSPKSPIP